MSASTSIPGSREPGEVQSVARASRLLSQVVESDVPRTLSELARATGLNVSTTYRLLGTLCGNGLLCRDETGERYLPGPMLMRLARSSLLKAGFGDVRAILDELAAATHETAIIGVVRGDDVMFAMVSPSPEPLRIHCEVGERIPVRASATGRALLALSGRPAARLATELAGETAPLWTTDRRELELELLATQFQGWSVVDDAQHAGVRSIAVPVLSGAGPPRIGLELRGPAARITDHEVDRLGEQLRRAAVQLAELPLSVLLA